MPATNWPLVEKVAALSDGVRTSREIAEKLSVQPRHVRKIWERHNLPRPSEGAQKGERNHQYRSGRHIDLDGYVLCLAPQEQRRASNGSYASEHRLVMERTIGRRLRDGEVVDHIDGLTLHNHPDNLRLFETNSDHLRSTIQGKPHRVSKEGQRNIAERHRRSEDLEPVDTYRRNKERGDVRLRAILRAALSLGIDSPFLCGSHRWIERAGIDPMSRTSLEQGLRALDRRWLEVHRS